MSPNSDRGLGNLCAIAAVLTASCNLACTYCYQNAKRPRRMNWDTLKAAIDLLLGSDSNEVVLTFYGGEPLLEFALIRRAIEYVESFRPSGLVVRYWLLTNGTLLAANRAAFLANHRVRTQISLDGVAAAQGHRGRRTIEILDRLLDRLRGQHRRWFREDLSISMTVAPQTIEHLAEGIDYLLAKGVQNIGFSPVLTDTSEWGVDDIEALRRQFGRVFESSLEHYRRSNEISVEVFRRHEGAPSPDGAEDAMCKAVRGDELAIDVDGEVYGCAMFAESYQSFPGEFLSSRLRTLRLGHIASQEFRKRLAAYPSSVCETEIFHDKQAKYSSYGRCRDCRYLERCQICPVSIGHMPGNFDPRRIPDFLCAFNLVYNEYRDRFPAQPDRRTALEQFLNLTPSLDNLRMLAQTVGRPRA
jgi:sulfatase maturation enzyme AslB (radical SAM superfamily)